MASASPNAWSYLWRNPKEWKSFDSSLPFLVKWRQCFPLWSRPNVSYFGRCIHDHRPWHFRTHVSLPIQRLHKAERSEDRKWIQVIYLMSHERRPSRWSWIQGVPEHVAV
jgi:hypothetical protein